MPATAWAPGLSKLLLVLLSVAILVVLGIFLRNYLMGRGKKAPEKAKEGASAAPDLSAEDVAATDLPAEGWLELARQMLSKGDRRLALRALYLASLAMLGDKGLIRIVRSKSNREYHRELLRRAHALPEVPEAFGRNVQHFEDTWYGLHDVTEEIVNDFAANHERMRRLVQA
jgi:hypothetical protein